MVKWYYFPIATNKRISYDKIIGIEAGNVPDLGFDKKTWGMALSPVWWPCDLERTFRDFYIILRLNSWPDCGLTLPADRHAKVLNILQKAYSSHRSHSAVDATAAGGASSSKS